MHFSQKTALITGASSGIGEAFAHELAAQGIGQLILTARSADKLAALAATLQAQYGTPVLVLPADLAAPTGAPELLARLEQAGAAVDVLINNAGVGRWADFLAEPADSYAAMVELNITALLRLTHGLLLGMVARGTGAILNVASTGAFQPCPYIATYCATKSFVLSFSEALHGEFAARGVAVTALCPGNTTTGFQATANADTRGMSADTPAQVAREGLAALLRNKPCHVVGTSNYLQSLLPRVLPRRATIRAVANMMDKRVHR